MLFELWLNWQLRHISDASDYINQSEVTLPVLQLIAYLRWNGWKSASSRSCSGLFPCFLSVSSTEIDDRQTTRTYEHHSRMPRLLRTEMQTALYKIIFSVYMFARFRRRRLCALNFYCQISVYDTTVQLFRKHSFSAAIILCAPVIIILCAMMLGIWSNALKMICRHLTDDSSLWQRQYAKCQWRHHPRHPRHRLS